MSFQSVVLALSPYAFLPLADTTGTSAADISGNNRAGTYISGPTFSQAGFTNDGSSSALFGNNSARVQLTGGPGIVSSTAFTIGFIVNPGDPATVKFVAGGGNAGFSSNSWRLAISPTALTFYVNNATGSINLSTAGIAINGGAIMLFIDYDGSGTWNLYVNGASTPSITITSQTFTAPSSPRIQIGCFSDQVGAGEIGYYQYVMQFASVLSGANRAAIYSASGMTPPLIPGIISVSSATAQISISTTAASGGTAPYTYGLFRSHNPGYGVSGFSQISSGSTTSFSDTPSDYRIQYYRYVISDSGSPQKSVQTFMRPGQLLPAVLIGAVGNSRTAGTTVSAGQDPVTQLARILSEGTYPSNVTAVNKGVGGSTTTDWLPNSANLNAAISSFATAAAALPAGSSFYIQIALGVNDARVDFHISLAQWKANIASIMSTLKAANFPKFKGFVLHCDYYCTPLGFNSFYDDSTLALLQSYNEAIPSMCDNYSVFQGDLRAYSYFALNAASTLSDQLHATAAGCISLGDMWAQSYQAILNPPAPARKVTLFRR